MFDLTGYLICGQLFSENVTSRDLRCDRCLFGHQLTSARALPQITMLSAVASSPMAFAGAAAPMLHATARAVAPKMAFIDSL